MALSTTHWIGLGGAAVALIGYVLWSKKVATATAAVVPATKPPSTPPSEPTKIPPGFVPPTTLPRPIVIPAGTVPAGWVPTLPDMTPAGRVPAVTPSETDAEYASGYTAGAMDGATGIRTNKDADKYESSPMYRSGYDNGYAAAAPGSAGTAGVGSAGMPRRWWYAFPKATAADFGMVPKRR